MKKILKTFLIALITFTTFNTSTVLADDDECDNCDYVYFCLENVCYLCTDDMGCIIVQRRFEYPQ